MQSFTYKMDFLRNFRAGMEKIRLEICVCVRVKERKGKQVSGRFAGGASTTKNESVGHQRIIFHVEKHES